MSQTHVRKKEGCEQYSARDREAWHATVHVVAKSQRELSD